MGVSRFEDLRVWQLAFELCREVDLAFDAAARSRDWTLWQQLNAAALSTVANIAEGFSRSRHREFAQFVRIARASNAEVRALLHVTKSRRYVSESEIDKLFKMTESVSKMLWRLEEKLR